MALECLQCAAKQSRGRSGLVPGKVRRSTRTFGPQPQNHRRQQRVSGNEHDEKPCEREPKVLSVAPQYLQHRVSHSKRNHEEKDCAERRGAQARVAVRTNDGRESRARPQRFRGHCVIALRAGHRLTPPEGRIAASSAQQGFAAWQTPPNLPQVVFWGSLGSHQAAILLAAAS
jgi:hypothetical protein